MTEPAVRAELVRRALVRRQLERRVWVPITPSPKQQRFISLDVKECLIGGATRSGKTDALLAAALRDVRYPGYTAVIFRSTIAETRLPTGLQELAHRWLDDTDAVWDGQARTWRFPSGAKLVFAYLKERDSHLMYKGSEYQFIGFDELTHFGRVQYQYLLSRLNRPRDSEIPLRARATTNPDGPGFDWVLEYFAATHLEQESWSGPDRCYLHASLADNPTLDVQGYSTTLDLLDVITRRRLRDGEWVRDASALVYGFDPRLNVCAGLPELSRSDGWRHVLGIDYGYHDATALVMLAYSRYQPGIYAVDCHEESGLTPSDVATLVDDWSLRYSPESIVADVGGLGKGYATESTQRYGHAIHAAEKRDKLGNIRLLNGDLQHHRLWVLDGPALEPLRRELAELPWKDEQHLAEHPGFPNHCTDALLYGYREAYHWASTAKPAEDQMSVEEIRLDRLDRDAARRQAAEWEDY